MLDAMCVTSCCCVKTYFLSQKRIGEGWHEVYIYLLTLDAV